MRCAPGCTIRWFLGRQWQLGEHRGRDAASPALVHLTVTETPLAGRSAAPEEDPQITPPEAIIESEPEQWWTVGRIRVARALRSAVPQARRNDSALKVAGRVRWVERSRSRRSGPLPGASRTRSVGRPVRGPGVRSRAGGRLAAVGAGVLGDVHRHRRRSRSRGTTAATSTGTPPRRRGQVRPPPSPPVVRTSYPTRVAYDGSPHPRWWQIEDHRYDPGAVAPHRTQLAAMMIPRPRPTATTGSRRRCSATTRSWPSPTCRSRT